MRGMAARWDGVAQWFARMAGSVAARVVGLWRGISPDTPLRGPGDSVLLAEMGRKTGWPCYVVGCRSGAGAKIGRRARLIHEKVIGHDLAVFAPGIGRRTAVAVRCGRYGRLALLAGRSRCSINQRANMAAVFSSSQESSNCVISLRRLAAWLRRESS